MVENSSDEKSFDREVSKCGRPDEGVLPATTADVELEPISDDVGAGGSAESLDDDGLGVVLKFLLTGVGEVRPDEEVATELAL